MTLTVVRQPPFGDSVMGQLLVDGVPHCLTLERASTLTAAGTYVVTFTPSQRCCDGALWSPDDDPAYRASCPWASGLHRLLLVNDVPGKSGIRLHAANEASELEGCTAVGTARQVDKLAMSRKALAALMNLVVPTLLAGSPVTIEYRQA